MLDFTPLDAYAAAIRPNGAVVIQDLSDPATIVTVVVEYEYADEQYSAIYHDKVDCWEVFGEDFYTNDRLSEHRDLCEQTIDQCRDKLLSAPNYAAIKHRLAAILTKKMSLEIMREIDEELIRNLHNIALDALQANIPIRPASLPTIVPAKLMPAKILTPSFSTPVSNDQFVDTSIVSRMMQIYGGGVSDNA